ncbi:MAG: gliding motility-associated C-terminal domain-containing protein, partial [Bacteroidia bacterium]|nr:gliding motility-associated C-terminal domain-containing protein [Bacteroidia bacterium]
YTYLWSSGGTNATENGLVTGTYTVTITDANGCTLTATAFVPDAPGPQAAINAQTNVSCFGGNNGDATVTVTGGTAPFTYNWSPFGGTGATGTGLSAGTYTVTVTDANGCTATATVTITEPPLLTASTVMTPVICNGGNTGTATVTAAGGTPAYTYLWSSGGTNATENGLAAGTYTVTVTDAMGCTVSATITITQPTAVTVTPGAGSTICIGASANITATGGGGIAPYTYVWNPGNMNGQNQTVTPSQSTTYTVTVTDANGCSATDTVAVVVNPLPVISWTSDTAGCVPFCVTFTNTTPNAATALWDFGNSNTSTTLSPSECYYTPGAYNVTLTVTDINGCVNTLTINNYIDVWPLPVADFTASPTTTSILDPTIHFTDQSQGATQWNWNFGDFQNGSSTLQNPSYTYGDTGTYLVTLVVANQWGCTDQDSMIIVITDDFTFYAPNAFTPNGDGFNEAWVPEGIGIDRDKFEMWIFDRWGNLIWQTDVWGRPWDGTANGGSEIVQEDVYVWKVVLHDIFGRKHQFVGHVSVIK